MKEIHKEVLFPSQRSPCRGCKNEDELKSKCMADCKKLKKYQDALYELRKKGEDKYEIQAVDYETDYLDLDSYRRVPKKRMA